MQKPISTFFNKPIQTASTSNRCQICQFHCTLKNCSILNKYCEKYYIYYSDRVPHHIYDPYHRTWLPVQQSVSSIHYNHVDEKRIWIRHFNVSNSSFETFKLYLEMVVLFYPSLMTDILKDCLIAIQNGYYAESITQDLITLLPIKG